MLKYGPAFTLLLMAPACSFADDRSDLDPVFELAVSKQIEASDETGVNRVSLTVTSPDADVLDQYDNDSVLVIPIREGEVPATLLGAADGDAALETPPWENTSLGADDDVLDVAFEVGSADLEPGVIGYSLQLQDRPEPAVGWKNYWYYGFEDCVAVQRIKLVRRVFVDVWVKKTSSSGWDHKVVNRKLAHNETLERCYNGSHQIKVKVRTKKQSAFTIEFLD